MKLRITTQNVQGLNAPLAVIRLRNFYSSQFRDTEMLCLQEHKLRGKRLEELGFKLWRQSYFFGCEAAPGYNHADGGEGAGKGGLCMFVNPKIKHLVHSQGTVGFNLAQWIRFLNIPGGDVAILNVYAPHTPTERIQLWQELTRLLPQGCRWVTSGDWNMVETARDKSSTCGRLLSGKERIEFDLLKAHLQVTDFFSYTGPLIYSWDNKQQAGRRVLARLDRMYSFSSPYGLPDLHVKKYVINGESRHSDHLPVTQHLELLEHQRQEGSRYKMNSKYLEDAEVIEQ
jgi:exonuclease III